MELMDAYNNYGEKTGRTIERDNVNDKLREGECFFAAHIFIRNRSNQFLVQKRSMTKKTMPGFWDITGGVVTSGEDSITGAIREVQEELGILLREEELTFVSRLYRNNCIIDIYDAVKDVDIHSCILQESEVDEVKFIGGKELLELFKLGPFYDFEYDSLVRSYYNM